MGPRTRPPPPAPAVAARGQDLCCRRFGSQNKTRAPGWPRWGTSSGFELVRAEREEREEPGGRRFPRRVPVPRAPGRPRAVAPPRCPLSAAGGAVRSREAAARTGRAPGGGGGVGNGAESCLPGRLKSESPHLYRLCGLVPDLTRATRSRGVARWCGGARDPGCAPCDCRCGSEVRGQRSGP